MVRIRPRPPECDDNVPFSASTHPFEFCYCKSGELQMYHFYSVTGKEAGIDNEVGRREWCVD